MPNGWGGADPIAQVDANDYALGTEQRANVDLRITHIRIYSPPGETSMAGRTGKLWTTTGGLLASVVLPSDLADGWSTHELAAPVARTANQRWVVAYDTGGNYGALIDGLAADVNSGDAAVTTLSDANATNGNGVFNGTPGAFPTNSPGDHFYGADVVYELGLVGNTAPRITSTSAIADQLQVTAAATVEDDESLTGLTLRIEWGDGATDTVVYPTLTAQHTYASAGVYPILFKATDSDGATDFAADYVVTTSPDPALFTLDVQGLTAAVCGAAQRIGHLDTVEDHEPREAPNTAMHAAFWFLGMRPARVSGLASVAMCVTLMGRLYIPAGTGTSQPYGEIDQDLTRATDRLMAAFVGDFTLGGLVRNVDIFGAHSPGLAADYGYADIGGGPGGVAKFRIVTFTLPLIVNDLYEEVP